MIESIELLVKNRVRDLFLKNDENLFSIQIDLNKKLFCYSHLLMLLICFRDLSD